MELDDTIEQVKSLIAQRDEIYAKLEAILGGERPSTIKRVNKCSVCGEEGHSSRTCPKKPQE